MKTLATIRDRYGVTKDGKSIQHVQAGYKGGTAPHESRYFRSNPDMASAAGRIGGLKSRRGNSKNWRKLNQDKIIEAENRLMEVAEKARAERDRAKELAESDVPQYYKPINPEGATQ